jgi:hypothetical protein
MQPVIVDAGFASLTLLLAWRDPITWPRIEPSAQ